MKMVDIYKRKYGRYKKVDSAPTIKKAEEKLWSMWPKGKYRVGKGAYIHQIK